MRNCLGYFVWKITILCQQIIIIPILGGVRARCASSPGSAPDKHRGNSFKLQNYKMRLKQIRLNWINSMQVKKILFTNVFFSCVIMLVKYVLSDGISKAFLPFRFVDVIVITDHDLFWNVGQANCILKYFENMMTDHSDSTIF